MPVVDSGNTQLPREAESGARPVGPLGNISFPTLRVWCKASGGSLPLFGAQHSADSTFLSSSPQTSSSTPASRAWRLISNGISRTWVKVTSDFRPEDFLPGEMPDVDSGNTELPRETEPGVRPVGHLGNVSFPRRRTWGKPSDGPSPPCGRRCAADPAFLPSSPQPSSSTPASRAWRLILYGISRTWVIVTSDFRPEDFLPGEMPDVDSGNTELPREAEPGVRPVGQLGNVSFPSHPTTTRPFIIG